MQTSVHGIEHGQDLNTVPDNALRALLAEFGRNGKIEPGSLQAEKVSEIEAILAARQ